MSIDCSTSVGEISFLTIALLFIGAMVIDYFNKGKN